MISKLNKRIAVPAYVKKLFLGAVLVLILWARLISNYNEIVQANSSFNADIGRSNIELSFMEEQKKDVDVHIENQEILSKNHGVKLKEISEQEQKSNQLKRFLARWDSPLINHTDYIVETADQFGIDYRLIPAIAVVESSACNINFRPYNCWGWGKSGFANYEQGIYTVSKGLAYGYGTSNPHIIGPRYNPVTPDAWASKVSMLMTQIQ